MKKKLLALFIAVLLAFTALIGCDANKTDVLDNTDGAVISGNGSFLVEKGDYVYFINGQDATTSDNTFGTPVKSSLVRVKKSDLAKPSEATVETVIPKIILTGNYATGVYFYGEYVYYATPCSDKDKTGTVQNSKTEFNRFNLTTGKADKAIAIVDDNTAQFKYVEKGDKVYLYYTFTETVDETTENKVKVIDATNGDEVYTSPAYLSVALPEDSSSTLLFVKKAFSKNLDQDESFNELYAYTVGDEDAKLVLSGAGSYALGRDDRLENLTPDQLLTESGIEGVTMSLIKNTGKLAIFKATTLDSNYASNMYFGAELENGGFKANSLVKLGDSNVHIDAAITATSYYESLTDIYYVDSEKYGLMKFNYTNASNDEFGTEIISTDCKNLSISFIEGNYMYLCNTSEGIYYRANYKDTDIKVKKINAISMQTSTSFYLPRVIGNYFIGSYSQEAYYKYIYVIDMTDIDVEKEAGEELSKYEKYLEDTAVESRETLVALNKTLLGKMADADKELFDTYLDTNYPEEE